MTFTKEQMFEMFSEAAVLVQNDESYRIDCVIDDEIYVTDEESGEEHILTFDDVDLSVDLLYGFKLLNNCAAMSIAE